MIAVSAVTGAWWLAIVLTGYLFVGNWLAYLCGKPMHAGLRDNVPDFRLLPPTAHPAVVSRDQVRLPVDDRVKLEAAIGELAPQGR